VIGLEAAHWGRASEGRRFLGESSLGGERRELSHTSQVPSREGGFHNVVRATNTE